MLPNQGKGTFFWIYDFYLDEMLDGFYLEIKLSLKSEMHFSKKIQVCLFSVYSVLAHCVSTVCDEGI